MLYDQWGYSTAVAVSILLASVAFLTAFFTVPETRLPVRRAAGEGPGWRGLHPQGVLASARQVRGTLPHSLDAFAVLLGIGFVVMFAWAFIEPRFMFYAYDNLGWTSSMLGLVMSTYGVAMMLGEFGFGQLSDRLGRKPVLMAGLVLFAAQFVGLAVSRDYAVIAASFVIAGLGNALYDPALSASVLDIAPVEHQARALGLKGTAASLGNILGPTLVVLVTPFLAAQYIFMTAAGIVAASALVFAPARLRHRPAGRGAASP
jgi:MFS family permease